MKKHIKYKSKLISIFVALSFMLNGANAYKLYNKKKENINNPFNGSTISIEKSKEKEIIEETANFLNKDINYLKLTEQDKKAYILFDSLLKNKKLSETDKLQFSNIIQYFIDNKYLNYQDTFDNLNTVYITNNNEEMKDAVGIYSAKYNYITLKSDKWYNYAITHELLHCEGRKFLLNYNEYSWFNEGLTTLLDYEYFNKEEPYTEEVILIRLLCEFVGSGNILKTRESGNINILKESLINKGLTKENVNDLLDVFTKYTNNKTNDNLILILNELKNTINIIYKNDEYIKPIIYHYICNLVNSNDYTKEKNKYYFNTTKIEYPSTVYEYYNNKPDITNFNNVFNNSKEIDRIIKFYNDYAIIDNMTTDKTITIKNSIKDLNNNIDGMVSFLEESNKTLKK